MQNSLLGHEIPGTNSADGRGLSGATHSSCRFLHRSALRSGQHRSASLPLRSRGRTGGLGSSRRRSPSEGRCRAGDPGGARIDQVGPIRRSANRESNSKWACERPTATHTGPSGHDTPARDALSALAGLGAACSPQELTRPNQRSTRGEMLVPPEARKVVDRPTAVQVRLRAHETETSSSFCEPVGSGVD